MGDLSEAKRQIDALPKVLKDSWVANSKNTSKKTTVDDIKIIMEGKGVDDDYLAAIGRRQKTSRETQDASSRRLLGKSLEDITSTEKRAVKSTSFCQIPSKNVAAACSPRAIQHSTIARLNERPSLDTSDLGFGSTSKKDNNNYEVAC